MVKEFLNPPFSILKVDHPYYARVMLADSMELSFPYLLLNRYFQTSIINNSYYMIYYAYNHVITIIYMPHRAMPSICMPECIDCAEGLHFSVFFLITICEFLKN